MLHHHRHLAAILFTDIVGYTAIMQHDEKKAVSVIKRHTEVLHKCVLSQNGEVLNSYGDGSLCIFSSAREAILSAIEIQKELRSEPKIPLRIGLHIGEIFFEDGRILGDAVNVASRIQSLGTANTILLSRDFFDKIRNNPELKAVSLGEFEFKNVDYPIEVFALNIGGLIVPDREKLSGKLKSDKPTRPTKPIFSRLPTIVLFIMLLLAAFLIYHFFIIVPVSTKSEKSIAVLPFSNLSNDSTQEYFSEGMMDEILNQLYKIRDFKVISRTSSMVYKGRLLSIPQIAKELKVAYCLQGSVQKQGQLVRVRVQLIDGKNDKQIWTENFDSDFKDIFAIQTGIAKQVAAALKTNLSEKEKESINKPITLNPDAYELYLKGRFHWNRRTKQHLIVAIGYFERATQLDPGFTLAWSGIADTYSILADNGFMPVDSIAEKANAAVQKAILLDSSLAEVRASSALYLSSVEGNTSAAIRELNSALRLNPNYASAYQWCALELAGKGQFNRALEMIDKAIQLDPLSERIFYSKALIFFYSRDFEKAMRSIRNHPPGMSEDALSQKLIAGIFYFQGKMDSAQIYARLSGDKNLILLTKPDISELKKRIQNNSSTAYVTGDEKAYYYAMAGEKDSAFAWLNKAVLNKEYSGLKFLAVSPNWDPLRSDPRFALLLQNSGIR
jgi:adenylate cyclase